MRHHQYNPDFQFVKEPVEFCKYTERELLQYCLGATMYMPGTKDFAAAIIGRKYPGLTSMVLCFEDACRLEDVPAAEENSIQLLHLISDKMEAGEISYRELPLIIFRIRNMEQFHNFAERLEPRHMKLITAFNFPKFNSENGEAYYSYLRELNEKFGEIIYGMPIMEDRRVAFKESRMEELLAVRDILARYKDIVLNIRVGGTDFSSCFGVRRGINYTIYDIMTVRDCLMDILNVFSRDNEYTLSGPVWEYFRASKEMRWKNLPEFDFTETLIKREPIVNDAVDGLLRELILDKANGFIGKTIIHPSHLNFVNGMLAVTREEYEDACQILQTSGGVIKSADANKMNEIGPHKNWAEKLYMRAMAYGVIENESEYLKLFG
ncbi:MAG: HpcH/HpaI aldolase/citrate lyase family protein [Roseburia sp.]|nr:HpcH/HpaI aldolase/citrate lyase family protein [Roseburia sp.]